MIKNEKSEKTEKNQGDTFANKLLETRQIILSGEINKESAKKIINELLLLEADSSKPIYLYIDSPGGDVDAGFAIFDMIRFIKPDVFIVGIGLVASAAALVLLAVPKEKRFGFPHSRYLIHQPLSDLKGVATDLEIHANELEKIRLKLNELISKETGMDLKKVSKDTDRDCWLDSESALSYGLISKIINTRSELPKK